MRLTMCYLVTFVFWIILYGIYSSNPHLVDNIAYACLGIYIGQITYKIVNWLDRITTKDKEE